MNNLKRAIDADLCSLRLTERERALLMQNAMEEKKVKKKLSVAFVLVTVLILLAAVAAAVVTIRETGRTIAQTEKENGDYLDWPVDKRVQVVRELMDEGYIQETAELKRLREGTLSETDAARTADAAIAAFTGEDAKYASFLSIMDAAWGPFATWTYEQQAWYSQLMTDIGNNTDGLTYYVTPSGALTDQEAVAIAKREVARVFHIEESVLNQFRVETSFQIPEDAEAGDKKAYWYVCLDTWNTGLNTDELPFSAIDMFVDPDTGALRDSLEEVAAVYQAMKERRENPLRQTISAFKKRAGEQKTFRTWSIESKASWSSEIAPQIRAYLAEHPQDEENLLGRNEIVSVAYTYGLPDDKSITREAAVSIARKALKDAYQLTEEELSLLIDNGSSFYINTFYDISDPSKPLWKFLFEMPSIYGADEALAARAKALYGKRDDYDRFFKVELNAYTGEVVRTFAQRSIPSTLEGEKDIL